MNQLLRTGMIMGFAALVAVGGSWMGGYLARELWLPDQDARSAEAMYQRLVGSYHFPAARRAEIIACLGATIDDPERAAPCFTMAEVEQIHAAHGVFHDGSIGI